MKNISRSLVVIVGVAALAIGGTIAYFSDTETSTGNTFTAGTIDIAIDGQNPWTSHYDIGDLKPGETGNINFDITNVGQNPVNVSKNISNFVESTGTQSEPECAAAGGAWDNNAKACDWDAYTPGLTATADKNDIQTQIVYDLSVKVYKTVGETDLIWWQTIYTDAEGNTLSTVYPSNTTYVDLGMIPVGGHMKVTQSYHFNGDAGNAYQGDKLSFDITVKGDQLTQANDGYAEVSLENKTGPPAWDIIQDDIDVTLRYKPQSPSFDFVVIGHAPLPNHSYVLAVGYDANTDVDKQVGTAATDGSGHIQFSGSVNLNDDMVDAKAWLVPAENWNNSGMNWTGWPSMVPNILWETGLINYDDTDI